MFEKREIYRAIAEAAYAIARAGDGLQSEERESFYAIIKKELDFESWIAESRFDLLDEMHPDPVKAFEYAVGELKKYKSHLSAPLKNKALAVAEAVAQSYGRENNLELQYIRRLKEVLEI